MIPFDVARRHESNLKGAVTICAITSAVIAMLLVSVSWPGIQVGHGDFFSFYAGAKLLGTGGLYSFDANEAVQRQTFGTRVFEGIYFIRFPAYAAAWKPLAALPYYSAYLCFQILNLAALVWIAMRAGAWNMKLSQLTFLPLIMGLVIAQDISFVVVLVLVFVALSDTRRDWFAGLALAACALKPHFFVLAPFLLLRFRRWRIVGGAVGGIFIWFSVSTLLAGPGWCREWWQMISSPHITPNPEYQPTIHGLALSYGLSQPTEAIITVTVLALVLYVAWHQPTLQGAFAVAIAGGLLLSVHAYMADCAILLPLIMRGLHSRSSAWSALLLLSPLPYMVSLLGLPFVAPVAVSWLIVTMCPRKKPCPAALPAMANASSNSVPLGR